MAIQYSGGPNINTTFTCTTGTRQEIVTGLEDALNSAGWTTISGHHTSNVLLESATTPAPQSLVCRVQLQDPGSGNCAQVRFRNQGNTKAQTNQLFLFPAAGKIYQVIANKYQFFCFSADSLSAGRTFVCGGVPYLPSFLQGVITECVWCHGNTCGAADADGTLRGSFRTDNYIGWGNGQANSWYTVNGNQWESYGPSGGSWTGGYEFPGHLQLMNQIGCKLTSWNNSQPPSYRWHDGSLLTFEPLLCWGLTSYYDEPMIRGQMWDAACVTGRFVADQTTSFDSNNWWVLTNNANWSYGSNMASTILLVIP